MNNKPSFCTVLTLIFALTGFLVAGCDDKQSAAAPQNNFGGTHAQSPYESRLQAAFQIMDMGKRNEAMEAIARDAAKEGDPIITRRALLAISDMGARNNAAATCAPVIAKAGKRADANALANLITDMALRDATLAKLAGE